ncbi:MAG: hypothetical protein ABL971_13790 [Vicinamibacterales bacterium]
MIHTVVCTDLSDYIGWQCNLLEYTWKRAAQPGELLRLVTCSDGDPLPAHRHMRVLRVDPPPARDQGYKAFERLFALEQWIAREKPDGTVLVVDPDIVFRRAIHQEAAPGSPRAQFWADYMPLSAETQAATWPMLIHSHDLARLLPRWIAFTSAIYATTCRWESDMHALVSAAAAGGLRFVLEPVGAFVGWPDEVVGAAPIVHYCQDVVAEDGEVLFAKRSYQPWSRVPGAERAHGYCRDLLQLIDDHARWRETEP